MEPALIDQRPLWSKSRIAKVWRVDRRTVDRLIDGIQPASKVKGHPVWDVIDVAPVMVQYHSGGSIADPEGDDFDPEKLPPPDRKAWYESEDKRLKVEKEKGRLIPDIQFEAALVNAFKQLKTVLVTFPDVLERDANLTPEQVIKAQRIVDSTLMQLYKALVNDSEPDD